MRKLSELLKLAKEEFNSNISVTGLKYQGLCSVFTNLFHKDIATVEEAMYLRDYMNYYLYSKHKFFYHPDTTNHKNPHYKDSTYNPGCYAWKPGLKSARNRWLDDHIKLHEK